MDTKTCSLFNIEKHINIFYINYSGCKICKRTRGLERCYETKDKISEQQKIFNEKNRDKTLLQRQNSRFIQIRELVRL